MASPAHTSVPGLDSSAANTVIDALTPRLASLVDLQLTLKHVHWNVVGAQFLSVHEMLDDHVEPVRAMTDAVAERIRTLGGTPVGTPAAVVATRSWDDYDLGVAPVDEHLAQLDRVYDGVISDHRAAIAAVEQDPVTEDLLITQTAQLEQFQWFVRSFLEHAGGDGSGLGRADRPPTDEESAAAERAARHVDVDEVGESYREMARVGAAVEGEGRVP